MILTAHYYPLRHSIQRVTFRFMEPSALIKFAVGLLAVINPVGTAPFMLGMTPGLSAQERRRIARRAALAATSILAVVSLVGAPLLVGFGISVASFRVIGGILFLLMSIDMLRVQPRRTNQTPEEKAEAETREDIAIVPLAIPMLAGPGAISTVLIFAQEGETWTMHAWLMGIVVLCGLTVWLTLVLAEPVGRVLGRTGMNILTRMMGLIVGALAIEYIGRGMLEIWPGLAG